MANSKPYNALDLKERLVHHLHNELIFGCKVKLEENEFHTCKECKRKAKNLLFFAEYELGQLRQKIEI